MNLISTAPIGQVAELFFLGFLFGAIFLIMLLISLWNRDIKQHTTKEPEHDYEER